MNRAALNCATHCAPRCRACGRMRSCCPTRVFPRPQTKRYAFLIMEAPQLRSWPLPLPQLSAATRSCRRRRWKPLDWLNPVKTNRTLRCLKFSWKKRSKSSQPCALSTQSCPSIMIAATCWSTRVAHFIRLRVAGVWSGKPISRRWLGVWKACLTTRWKLIVPLTNQK